MRGERIIANCIHSAGLFPKVHRDQDVVAAYSDAALTRPVAHIVPLIYPRHQVTVLVDDPRLNHLKHLLKSRLHCGPSWMMNLFNE